MPSETTKDLDGYDRRYTWSVVNISGFSGGVDRSKSADKIDDQDGFLVRNLYQVNQGPLTVDTGYKQIGQTTRGKPKGGFEHEDDTGAKTFLLVTDDTVYKYDPGADQWKYISAAYSQALTVAAIATDTTLTVASTVGLANGDFIGIELDNGTQFQTKVNGVPGPTTIPLLNAMPSAAAIGRIVVEAVALTGSDSWGIVFDAVPWHNWTVFTNGVNPPMYYDGVFCKAIPNLPSAGSTVCRTLAAYEGYLVLADLIVGGTRLPWNVMWSDNGDATVWSSGDAGSAPLLKSKDPTTAMKKLGRDLILYNKHSATRGTLITTSPSPFAFTTINFGRSVGSEGVGTLSSRSVIALEHLHIVPAVEGVYAFSGGTSLQRLSQKIDELINNIDQSKLTHCFSEVLSDRNWVAIFYPTTQDTFPRQAFLLHRITGEWSERKFDREFSFAASRTPTTGVRYIDLVGTMQEQKWTALTLNPQAGSPVIVLGDPANNKVFEYDYRQTTEDTQTPLGQFISKQYNAYDRSMRLDWVEVEFSSGSIQVVLLNQQLSGTPGYILYGELTNPLSISTTLRIRKQMNLQNFAIALNISGTNTSLFRLSFRYRQSSRWPVAARTGILGGP